MTLYEFNTKDNNTKYDTVFTKGTYLDVIVEGNIRFALYALDMFFVEIEYDNVHNKILNLKSFKTGHLLDKFAHF